MADRAAHAGPDQVEVTVLPGRGGTEATGVCVVRVAWGLMPLSLYRASVDKALRRDWEPRFARLGFDAKGAWAAAELA